MSNMVHRYLHNLQPRISGYFQAFKMLKNNATLGRYPSSEALMNLEEKRFQVAKMPKRWT
jgi:hypothetical protein